MNRANDDSFPFTPLVIIGAGRSGTNALRDALVRLEGFATWPCDEINPIWRHGNLTHPDDEIPPEKATPSVRHYIRQAFRKLWRQQGTPRFVVEKTCANALRVPFVDAVLPEARYIHIVRDGYDVFASAEKRWRGGLEMPSLKYFLAKARYAPLIDLPRYAFATIRNRIAVRTGLRTHLKSWGPRFAGMDAMGETPVTELVALQWAACVDKSDAAFATMSPKRVFQLRYEDFTANPVGVLRNIVNWLDSDASDAEITKASASVRNTSVGKGRKTASPLPEHIRDRLKQPLAAHGYKD